ncbi:MAG TPA: DUF4328 domain-containing protein [Psychromonas sp.]
MSSRAEGFKSLINLTKWIRVVLYAQIIVASLAIIFSFLEYRLLADYQAGLYASLQAAFDYGEITIVLLQGTGIASLIAFVVSAILILQWIYRANYNVRQFGAQNLSYTPAWSIAYYFIPLFNLWKPYQAMKEIWLASKNPLQWSRGKTAAVLPVWWALWLCSNLLNQSIFRLSADAKELAELMNLNLLSQISNVLDIALAIVTLALVSGICQMQSNQQ